MKLAIGLVISNNFPAPTAFWDSYEGIVWRLAGGDVNRRLPPDLQISGARRIKSGKFPTDVARNEICRGFLDGDEDYLLFLDADMTFPIDLVEQLLVERKPVITARYHSKKPPFQAIAFVQPRIVNDRRRNRYSPVHFGRGVFEIDRCGAGALLIRRDVLQAIRDRLGDEWFRYQRSDEEKDHGDFAVSEDFWFCQQAQASGFSIWCKWDVECLHLTMQPVGRIANMTQITSELDKFQRMTPEEQQRVIDSMVVCGIPEGLEIAPGVVVPEYGRRGALTT